MTAISATDRSMIGTIIRRAAWKWLRRNRIERLLRPVWSSVDRETLEQIRRRYPTTPGDVGPNKYANIDYWLRESVVRALRLKLDRPPSLRVLDLGCGTGYFLLVCRTLGHDARGIDLEEVPVFNDMVALLGVSRQTHFVSPESPLPPGEERYDLITAFMITFNGVESDREWKREEWAVFLDNCLRRLTPGGRLFLSFNYSQRRGCFYDAETADLFDSLPGCRTRREGNEVLITLAARR